MHADYEEDYGGSPLAGLLHPDEDDGYAGPVEEDGGEPGAAGMLAPLREPRTGLRADIHRLSAAISSRHDWQPPTIREQREAADPDDPHQRWVGGPATRLLLTLLLILHDRGHSRAAAAVLGATALILAAITIILLTHKGV